MLLGPKGERPGDLPEARRGRVTRRFQIVALWALSVLTLVIWVGVLSLAPILLLGWAVVGLWDEQADHLSLWQLWPPLLIFLILGVLWWALIAWMRRTDRQISN
jgi:hypothetical protein